MHGIPFIKRTFDITVVLLCGVITLPVIGLIALSVRVLIGKPILFKQQRPGYKGMPFYIYKFRTMTDSRSADGNLLPDAERITRFGRFLRSTSMDELPELWNVL